MNVEQIDFFNKFYKEVTVNINWPLLFEIGWRIEKCTVSEVMDLQAKCVLPWYTAEGREVKYDDPRAKPVNLKDIEEWLGTLDKKRQHQLESTRHTYSNIFQVSANGQDFITFEMPAYRLPHERWLVLDRCHRLSAIALLEKPPLLKIEVQLIICTPLCEAILPDLKHFKS